MILLLPWNFTRTRTEVQPPHLAAAARLAVVSVALLASMAPAWSAPELAYRIVAQHPHDATHFTQGLSIEHGRLYESTGRYGSSAVYEKRLRGSEILREHALPDRYFGEGLTVHDDRIIQLTWRERTGFVYDRWLRLQGSFGYGGEGWGITVLPLEQTTLAVSDGSAVLRLLHPRHFTEVGTLRVTDDGQPISRLNELEYANGLLYANVWQEDRIAAIDPASGNVTGWLNLAGLRKHLDLSPRPADERVLNGIAYDAASGHLFVTGKCWPRMFELAVDLPATASQEKEKPRPLRGRGFTFKSLAVSYFRMAYTTLSSALSRFTSVFGMGTGGSNSLMPPGGLAGHTASAAVQPNGVCSRITAPLNACQ